MAFILLYCEPNLPESSTLGRCGHQYVVRGYVMRSLRSEPSQSTEYPYSTQLDGIL
jgi:hypothetical protein